MSRRNRGYGHIPSIPDSRDIKVVFTDEHVRAFHSLIGASPSSTTTSFDLRSVVKLPQALSDIDQGSLGSCTANAIAYAYAFDEIKQKNAEVFLPSRLFIYYNERLMEGTVNEDSGAQVRDGIKSINKYGVCDEHHWIYDPTQFTVKPPLSVYKEATNAKSLSYASIDFSADRTPAAILSHLKRALASGYPFVFGFIVYESFESDSVAETGMVPMPSPNESVMGGHCVCSVGYDDKINGGSFIVKNSWGSSWGLDGYFYMPYAYMCDQSLTSDFWTIQRVTNPTKIPNFSPQDINPDQINLNAQSSSGGVVN